MTSVEIIIDLMRRFPYFPVPQSLIDNWDAEAFDKWASAGAGVFAESEIIIAQFILMVWNFRKKWKSGPFNIGEAMTVLSGQSRAVIQEWCMNPVLI